MAVYYKPQSPIQSGEDFIYPLTTSDQVMVDENTRLNAVGVYLENIDNSTDTTVYGNNATTLGGVAAEDYALKIDTAPDSSKLGGIAAIDYALKTDTAPDSSKLGGKAPEYYLQPRNLLDNSDFTNPVNQRGASAYKFDAGYTIDRWKLYWSGDGDITIHNGYISLYRETHNTYLFQFPANVEKMVGKTYTVAAKVRYNGYIGWIDSTQRTHCNSVHSYDWVIVTHTFTVGSATSDIGSAGVEIATSANLSFELQWIALYEGSYTADTLPPYVPKGYAAELAECQRYYLPVSEYWNMGVILTGTGYICLNIPTNIKMRISPTTIMSNPRMYHPAYNWVDLTYRTLEWHAPFYRIIFDWPSSIQANISDIVLINGVTGLSADL